MAATTRFTAEMVRALPDDGNRYEVIDGELFVTPSPTYRHQEAVRLLFLALHRFLEPRNIGKVMASPADISTREDRLVQPDLFVFSRGQRPVRDWTDITHLVLAVEVLSPSTARADRQAKRRLYAEIADEYWIADLDARLIERWRPGDTRPEILTELLSWQPGGGGAFELDLPRFFQEVDGEQ